MIYFAKLWFVSVDAEQDVLHPSWRCVYLFADCVEISVGITFDDEFVMSMASGEVFLSVRLIESYNCIKEN